MGINPGKLSSCYKKSLAIVKDKNLRTVVIIPLTNFVCVGILFSRCLCVRPSVLLIWIWGPF